MAESIGDLARRIDAELAERLPEVRRLADAYVALTGERAPTLVRLMGAQAAGRSAAALGALEEGSGRDLAPDRGAEPAPAARSVSASGSLPVGGAGRSAAGRRAARSEDERVAAILRVLRKAAAEGDGWVRPKELYEAVGGRRVTHLQDVRRLLDAGVIEDNGRETLARRLRIASASELSVSEAEGPVVGSEAERQVARSAVAGGGVSGEVDVERLFPEDEPRQRIARAALRACADGPRWPAAVASEYVLNRQETAYVMRELAREGVLVEVDGEYRRA